MRAPRFFQPAPQPTPECLFLGPVRAINDRKAGDIVIETTKDHPQGFGIAVCRLPQARMAEARAIVALSDLIASAPPFAALGRSMAGHDPEDPLFTNTAAKLAITAGDAQAISAALERALGPADSFRSAAVSGNAPKLANKP